MLLLLGDIRKGMCTLLLLMLLQQLLLLLMLLLLLLLCDINTKWWRAQSRVR